MTAGTHRGTRKVPKSISNADTGPGPEAVLYAPVKAWLERLGYAVKGEVRDCDIVACRGDDPPVIIELKARLTLDLLVQAVDRQRLTDAVYIAVPATVQRTVLWRRHRRGIERLCRKLGVGLLLVDPDAAPPDRVVPMWDPTPYRPRRDPVRAGLLLREFSDRQGDPNVGGTPARRRMTAYRQRVVRLARHLAAHGPTRVADLRDRTGVAAAAAMLQRDHYNWFERVARGTYQLSPRGRTELAEIETEAA